MMRAVLMLAVSMLVGCQMPALVSAVGQNIEREKKIEVLAKYDQQLMHMDPAQYTRFAEDTFRREKALVEKLGLAKPG